MLKVDEKKRLELPNIWPADLYNADLVRIGTIGEGSCFFHSLFRSLNKDNYISLSVSERKKMIREERQRLSILFSSFYVKTVNSVLDIQDRSLIFYKRLYVFLDHPSMILKKEYQKEPILKKLMNLSSHSIKKCLPDSFSSFEKQIIDSPLITSHSSNLEEWENNFSTLVGLLNENNKLCKESIEDLVNTINGKIKKVNIEKFKELIADPCEFVSDEFIKFLSDYYNLDIYFIDIKNKKIYMAHENLLKGNRPSVIVATIDNTHFESIGLRDREKKETVLVFEPEHPLISKIFHLIKEKKPKGEINDINLEEIKDKSFIELYDLLMPLIDENPDDHEENIKRLTLLVNVAYKEIV